MPDDLESRIPSFSIAPMQSARHHVTSHDACSAPLSAHQSAEDLHRVLARLAAHGAQHARLAPLALHEQVGAALAEAQMAARDEHMRALRRHAHHAQSLVMHSVSNRAGTISGERSKPQEVLAGEYHAKSERRPGSVDKSQFERK